MTSANEIEYCKICNKPIMMLFTWYNGNKVHYKCMENKINKKQTTLFSDEA